MVASTKASKATSMADSEAVMRDSVVERDSAMEDNVEVMRTVLSLSKSKSHSPATRTTVYAPSSDSSNVLATPVPATNDPTPAATHQNSSLVNVTRRESRAHADA